MPGGNPIVDPLLFAKVMGGASMEHVRQMVAVAVENTRIDMA